MNTTKFDYSNNKTQPRDESLSFEAAKYLIIKRFAKGLLDIRAGIRTGAVLTPAQQRQFFDVVQRNMITCTTQALNVAEQFVYHDVFLVDKEIPQPTELPQHNLEELYIAYLHSAYEAKEMLPRIAQKRAEIDQLVNEIDTLQEYKRHKQENYSDQDIRDTISYFKSVYLKISEITRYIYCQ